MEKGGYLYIITNAHHTVLYVGITTDLVSRIHQHKTKAFPKSFSARYNLTKLVYWEGFHHMADAVAREKQLKAGSRVAKERLIDEFNPGWRDLSNDEF